MAAINEDAMIILVILYLFGSLAALSIVMCLGFDDMFMLTTYTWHRPWIPAVTRRDACAMPLFPIFFILPAVLWPLTMVFLILRAAGITLWRNIGTATSCCGIPLPRRGEQQPGAGDLELGVFADSYDPDARVSNAGQVSVLSARSAEFRARFPPPPYAPNAGIRTGENGADNGTSFKE